MSSVSNSYLCLFKWFSHMHKSSVRTHQREPCWWQRGLVDLSQGGAILKNQSRAKPVSFCPLISMLLFVEWSWSPVLVQWGKQLPKPQPFRQLHVLASSIHSRAAAVLKGCCHTLLWLSSLLRCVKLLTWTYGPWRREGFLMESGRGWLWVSFWKCSVPEQKPAGGAGSRHFPAHDPVVLSTESSCYSWFNEDAEVTFLQGILSSL